MVPKDYVHPIFFETAAYYRALLCFWGQHGPSGRHGSTDDDDDHQHRGGLFVIIIAIITIIITTLQEELSQTSSSTKAPSILEEPHCIFGSQTGNSLVRGVCFVYGTVPVVDPISVATP